MSSVPTVRLPGIEGQVRAVTRVEELLRRVSGALDGAGIPYAVIGGNAIAAWVSTRDADAVRATKDVDMLVRREDLPRISQTLRTVNMEHAEVLGVHMFVDRDHPSPKSGVHLIFARERIRPDDPYEAPDPGQATEVGSGYRVLELRELVKLKLLAFRDVDRVHIRDLLGVGLIDESFGGQLPAGLRERFEQVLRTQ
jgi:hypothetical protein